MSRHPTTLLQTREPTEYERKRGADVVFVREGTDGQKFEIYACRSHESWQQWGQIAEILGDNVEDVEKWRRARSE